MARDYIDLYGELLASSKATERALENIESLPLAVDTEGELVA